MNSIDDEDEFGYRYPIEPDEEEEDEIKRFYKGS